MYADADKADDGSTVLNPDMTVLQLNEKFQTFDSESLNAF